MKPPSRNGSPDDFQTPPEALQPLLPYIDTGWVVWECASGECLLSCELMRLGYEVVSSDTLYSPNQDFLSWQPDKWDCIVTNPPFSLKQQFLERSYSLGKPFALLLPLTTFETGKRQRLFRNNGVEVIFFDRRINFVTPNKVNKSSAWFATAWFTWGLGIGQPLTFVELPR